MLNLPEEIGLMLAGLGLLGIGIAGITVPVLPELIESVAVEEFGIPLEQENKKDEKDKDPRINIICDKASTMYNMAFSLGGAIAPILGGVLDDAIGFRSTSDVMAVSALITAIFYFVIRILLHKEG
jgi:MFS family permease